MNEELVANFLNKIKGNYSEEDYNKIRMAAEYANTMHAEQKRKSGEPYIIHPLAVAETLAMRLNMDADTVCAGLLHDVIEDTKATEQDVEEKFGKNVCELVQGVTKIAAIKSQNRSVAEAETIRKMFIAMSKNMPVIIIKLSDKLHNMSTLQYMDPVRAKEIASACLDIYAPLADRLGISWMKAELEDLSLKTLKPDTYQYIQDYLQSKRGEFATYLDTIKRKISNACVENGIKNVKIVSREKHIYSIYMKMKKRRKELDEIFDILGVRVICNSVTECYTLVGIIHQLWPPMEGRFKDYIAMPKANNYQSLHTTIMGMNGVILEVQIRTYEMDKIAEYGVASHWVYKVQSGSAAGSQSWVNMDSQQLSRIASKLKSWNTEIEQSESFMDEIKGELLKDTIYVFTPKGKAIELPIGSTALDFAYTIHTEVGNHTVSAKANGNIIPLGQPLQNTQVIEIVTQKNARPRITWLKYAHTTSARRKIRSWLNKYDENLLIDKNIVAKKKEVEAAIAEEQHQIQDVPAGEIVRQYKGQSSNTITVGRHRNLMIQIAQCCNPTPGDKIVGYVSRGRGIIVHKVNCPNLSHMNEIEQRKIDVQWEMTESITRKFIVTSKRTQDLFSEIEAAIRNQHGHLVSGSLIDDEMGNLVGTFSMECDDEDSYRKILKSIRNVPNVIKISPAPAG